MYRKLFLHNKERYSLHYGFFTSAYRPKKFFWEAIENHRMLLCTLFATLYMNTDKAQSDFRLILLLTVYFVMATMKALDRMKEYDS